MGIEGLVEKFGVELGLLIFFIWQNWKTQKEHKEDMKGIVIQAVQALDKTSSALADITPLLNELQSERKKGGA